MSGKGNELRDVLLNVSPAYQAFLDMHPGGEPFKGESIHAEGWRYKDLPPLTYEQMETFLDTVGEENIRPLSVARHKGKVRGQMFISPEGQKRLSAYLAAPPKPGS